MHWSNELALILKFIAHRLICIADVGLIDPTYQPICLSACLYICLSISQLMINSKDTDRQQDGNEGVGEGEGVGAEREREVLWTINK